MSWTQAEWVVQDLETGQIVDGVPDIPLASAGRGWAWQPANDPGVWHLRDRSDPSGAVYRLVQVYGGPNLDPKWYENTIENLETSEG